MRPAIRPDPDTHTCTCSFSALSALSTLSLPRYNSLFEFLSKKKIRIVNMKTPEQLEAAGRKRGGGVLAAAYAEDDDDGDFGGGGSNDDSEDDGDFSEVRGA